MDAKGYLGAKTIKAFAVRAQVDEGVAHAEEM